MGALCVVDDELEDVGAGVVADGVVLHLACGWQGHVERCIYDGFLVPNRLGYVMAEGVYDAAASTTDELGELIEGRVLVEVLGVGAAANEHVCVDEKAFALDGYVLDGSLPLGVVVSVW